LFAALIFSGNALNAPLWGLAVAGFAAFCLLASSGYLLNDIMDRHADRKHPKKRKRPIASGALPVHIAWIEMVVLLGLGVAISGWISPLFLVIGLLYLGTTISYSLFFKHRVILDVMVLSLCYLWRAMAGAVAIDVPVSSWLFLCTAFFALFIGFNKRKAELVQLGSDAGTRKNLTDYSQGMLDQYQAIVTGAAVVSYALYAIGGAVTPWMALTIPFVLYAMFRYIYLVESKGQGDAPDETLLRDAPLIVTVLLYGVVAAGVLQLHAMELLPELGTESEAAVSPDA